MPKYYKLTDEHDRTYGGCQWGENVTVETSGEGDLCDPGWTHWYTDPLLAVLLNPIHGDYDLTTAHLWESPEDQVAEKFDHGLKVGCKRGTTVRRIQMPEVTMTQKVAFGILASLEVYKVPDYVAWATAWLSGEDRSVEAVEAAWAAWAAGAAGVAGVAGVAREAREAAWAAKAAWAAELDLVALARKAMDVK